MSMVVGISENERHVKGGELEQEYRYIEETTPVHGHRTEKRWSSSTRHCITMIATVATRSMTSAGDRRGSRVERAADRSRCRSSSGCRRTEAH